MFGAGELRTLFVHCLPRTGSTAVVSLFDNCSIAGGELLSGGGTRNPTFFNDFATRYIDTESKNPRDKPWKSLHGHVKSDPASFFRHLDEARRQHPLGSFSVFKAMPGVPLEVLFSLPNSTHIILVRNPIDRFFSLSKAKKTGKWHGADSTTVGISRDMGRLKQTLERQGRWLDNLETWSARFSGWVAYEEIFPFGWTGFIEQLSFSFPSDFRKDLIDGPKTRKQDKRRNQLSADELQLLGRESLNSLISWQPTKVNHLSHVEERLPSTQPIRLVSRDS